MKKISVILLSALIAASSCRKDNISASEIPGKWELIRRSAFPGPSQTFPPGNGEILFLGEDGTFQRRNHDTVILNTTYRLKKKKDCYMDGLHTFINTADGGYSNDYIKIAVENDTLRINTSSCLIDGGGGAYRRLDE